MNSASVALWYSVTTETGANRDADRDIAFSYTGFPMRKIDDVQIGKCSVHKEDGVRRLHLRPIGFLEMFTKSSSFACNGAETIVANRLGSTGPRVELTGENRLNEPLFSDS
jgi:hypothetical protein